MPNFAQIVIAGHIGQEPELKRTPSDMAVCDLSMAVNTGYGERKQATWYRVTFWGKSAESASKHLTKGTAVIVSGEPSLEEWTDKEGNQRQTLKVRGSSWAFAGGRGESSPAESSGYSAPQAAQPAAAFDDEIPF